MPEPGSLPAQHSLRACDTKQRVIVRYTGAAPRPSRPGSMRSMIRNVVMVKLKDDHDPEWVADLRSRFAALNCPGTLSYTVGPDAGLREGNWSFAIVADFADTESYLNYDSDERHNRLRAELAPHAEQVARMQFEL